MKYITVKNVIGKLKNKDKEFQKIQEKKKPQPLQNYTTQQRQQQQQQKTEDVREKTSMEKQHTMLPLK